MRVIGGSFRGQRLVAPGGRDTRPTSDRVREAVFSSLFSLAGGFEGRHVLDLYAGSGALGIEALSRGAAHVVFVERDRRAAGVIVANLESLRIAPARWRVLTCDASRLVKAAGLHAVSLLFADPPYTIECGRRVSGPGRTGARRHARGGGHRRLRAPRRWRRRRRRRVSASRW
jgi:RNA methyltransferase, RsmD family